MKRNVLLIFVFLSMLSIVGCTRHTDEDILSSQAQFPDSKNPADYIDTTYIDYPDAPSEYRGLLNYYRLYIECFNTVRDEYGPEGVNYRFGGKEENLMEFESPYSLGEVNVLVWHTDKKNFGYGIYDINGDGIFELILMTSDSKYKYVWKIYSIYEEKPKELFSFSTRGKCTKIDEDGMIHSYSSGGANNNIYSSCKISDGGGTISSENIWEEAGYDRENGIYYMKYTYWVYENYDPKQAVQNNQKIETLLEPEEGEAMVEKLRIELQDDVAPFIKFTPLF